VVQCLENLAEQIEQAAGVRRFAPACIEYPIYMVHFIDRILGAHVYYQDDQWNAKYLETRIGALEAPDLEKDDTWALARRATLAFLEQEVALPLFGLPTLSSPLNIFVNLYGGEALATMLSEPEEAERDLATIKSVIRETHKWYLKTLPQRQLQPVISWCRTQPPGYGQLCGCTTQLVSGPMYRRMVAPLDDALLGLYPKGGMVHLCGSHTQHIETMRDMKNLKAIQLNDRAAHDLQEYFDGLRDDQMIYLNPCEGMTQERGIEITGGKRLVICDAVDAPVRPGGLGAESSGQ
jgi:hypothetical protein